MYAFILPPIPLSPPSSISIFHPSRIRISPQAPNPHLRLHAKLQAPSNPPSSPPIPQSPLPPIAILLAETAIQLSIAAFAIIASLLARTRFLAFASAFFAIPQVLWSVRRYLHNRRTRTNVQPPFEATPPTDNTHQHTALATAPDVPTLITQQAQSLRYALDQVERSALEREDRRNASIAHMLSSLDSSLRDLRRVVETRNRAEDAAPIPLVAEVEVLRGRLREAEREKREVKQRLRLAEVNFQEAKRGGETLALQLEEAVRREMVMTEELEELTVKTARLDQVMERLERAELRNEELKQRILGGVREREEWKGRAGDAESQVKRVQNLMGLLKERFGIRDEDTARRKNRDTEDLDAQLRERRSFGTGSLLYEELLGEDKKEAKPGSLGWPDGALEGGNSDKKQQPQLHGLPPDGGFGAASEDSNQASRSELDGGDVNAPQLPGSGVDNVFSFSRGEFEGSLQQNGGDTSGHSYDKTRDNTNGEGRGSGPENVPRASMAGKSELLVTEVEGDRNEHSLQGEIAAPARNGSSIGLDSGRPDSWQSQSPGSEVNPSKGDPRIADENKRREREPQWSDDESRSNPVVRDVSEENKNPTSKAQDEGKKLGDAMGKPAFGSDSSQIMHGEVLEKKTAPLRTTFEDINAVVSEAANAPHGPMISREIPKKGGTALSGADLDGTALKAGVKSEENGSRATDSLSSYNEGVDVDGISLQPFSTSEFLRTREQNTMGVLEHDLTSSTDVDKRSSEDFFQLASPDSLSAEDNLNEDGQTQTLAPDSMKEDTENRPHPLEPVSENVPSSARSATSPLPEVGLAQKSEEDISDVSLLTTPLPGVKDPSRGDGLQSENGSEVLPESMSPTNSFSTISGREEHGAADGNVEEGQVSSNVVPTAPVPSTEEPSLDVETGSAGQIGAEQPGGRQREFSSAELRASANELVRKARRRGLAVSQSGRLFQSAISKLEAALELGEERAAVEGQLGATLVSWAKTNIGDSKAKDMLERALGLLLGSVEERNGDEETICSLGLCLCLLGSISDADKARGYYERACGLYDGLLERNGGSRIGYFNCGLAYISLGRLGKSTEENEGRCRKWFEKAEERFERAVELDADDVKAQMYVDDCRREIAGLDKILLDGEG